mmetsp:Transcript_34298/g.80842  ORF Transcript_34298/g.80842 Transcript_34298/m.80842 type:complete len:217 (-) Transcript_34298:836-1486(-)
MEVLRSTSGIGASAFPLLLRLGLSGDTAVEVDLLVERVRILLRGGMVDFFSTRQLNEAAVGLFATLSFSSDDVAGDTFLLTFSRDLSEAAFFVAVVERLAFFSAVVADDFDDVLALLVGSDAFVVFEELDFSFCSCHSRSCIRRDERRGAVDSFSSTSNVVVVDFVCTMSSSRFASGDLFMLPFKGVEISNDPTSSIILDAAVSISERYKPLSVPI